MDRILPDVVSAGEEEYFILARSAVLWGHDMGKVIIKIKALPKDTSGDSDKIVNDIKVFLSKYGAVYKSEVQPLAFGLTVIMITLVVDEDQGTAKLEEAFPSFEAASLNISEVSRAPDF